MQQDKISHNWTLKFILHGSVLLTPCIHILSMCLHFIHTRLRKFKYCIALACKMVFPHLKCKVIPQIFLSLAIWEIRIFKSCLSHQRWLILCVNNTIILVIVLCSFSRSKHDWKNDNAEGTYACWFCYGLDLTADPHVFKNVFFWCCEEYFIVSIGRNPTRCPKQMFFATAKTQLILHSPVQLGSLDTC